MKFVLKTLIILFTSHILATLQGCNSDDTAPDLVKADQSLFINEISANDSPDWLELYNPADTDVNLEGYKIYDDVENPYVLGADVTIPAKGFKVLYCDDLAEGDHTNFKLSSNGETVTFVNAKNELLDEVHFPAMEKGEVYARSQDGSASWGLTTSPTKGANNTASIDLRIINVTQTPEVVLPSNDIIISAGVQGVDLSTVKLYYTLQGKTQSELDMTLVSAQTYSDTIPGQATSTTINYYIEISDSDDQTVTAPENDQTYKIVISTDPLPKLFINEFLAINTACCADTDGAEPEFDDWIEIYNNSDQAINLAGYYITDSPEKPFMYQISSSNASETTVSAKGFLVLWADEELDQGANHVNIKLSGSGEYIGLQYGDGRLIDGITFEEQQADISTGRSVDGAGTWVSINTPSPNKSNQ